MSSEPFYALRPQWIKRDPFYLIWAKSDGLYCCWLSDQFFDRNSVRIQFFLFYLTVILIPVLEFFASRVVRTRAEMERKYLATSNDFNNFFEQDERNLFIPRKSIDRIVLSRKRNWWTIGWNRGTMVVATSDGKEPKFLIPREQDVAPIATALTSKGHPVYE
jgi:hypothetical protein